jgi:3-phosphoshikimate 1-carboxyvinyltransferase
VKSAILLAGLAAHGGTEVTEAVPTRDHTERALRALDAPVEWRDGVVRLSPFQHEGFAGEVPGDPSSAAFLVAAAALTGSEVTIRDVGLNPSRIRFLEVLRRMGIETTTRVERIELGEPVGEIVVHAPTTVRGTRVPAEEFPLVHDESPVLAMVASHAESESRFEGAGELRVKEADRLSGIAEGIRELGGEATVEDDALVVAGGGLAGGRADARGDHRLAMAFAVTALAARGTSEVTGIEWARVSFPGFGRVLRSLGGDIEVGR